MFETINRGPTKAILSGCGAVLLGWAGFLYFFTSKDNPYELGWLFMLLGFAGVCVAAALSGLVIAGIVRARGAFAFSSRVIVMLACPFMPLLGWTGALGMAYTDATPGSVFMFWALVFSISGFLAPLAAAGLVRFQKRAAVEAGRADDASEKRPSSHPVAVYGAAGAPGLIAAVLFALAGNFQYDRFFTMLLVLISVTSAASLPALIAVIVSFRRKTRKLILGLALWLVGTALLLGFLLGFYILYEIIYGIMHFRL